MLVFSENLVCFFFLVTYVLRFAFFLLLPTKCGRQKCIMKYKTTRIFICNTFISNATLKLAKNQANAKHKPEAELLLFENYSHSSSTLSSKNNRTYSKKKQKNKCLCIHEIIWFVVMKMKMKMKNRSHRYDINRPRPRSSIHEKLKQHWGVAYKKHVFT